MAPPASGVRLLLGLAQMFGASLGLILLATSGLTTAVLGVVLGTTGLTLLSRRLVRGRRPDR